jgi:sugar lactone lactonase YvrE
MLAFQQLVVSTVIPSIIASGGVSVAPDGRLYVADFGATLAEAGGTNVYRISPGGTPQVFSSGFGGASGNSFGRDGFLYQSDVARGEVYRLSADGRRTRIAVGLTSPVGVTSGPDQSVYVVQCTVNTISRIAGNGGIQTVATGPPLNCPNGLTFGPDGKLYTVNFRDGAMISIELPAGKMTVHAEIPGGGNGNVVAANGRFNVTSYRGHRIYEVSATGKVCLLAGTGELGNADGDATIATFFRPNGVAISADGDRLYTNTTAGTIARGQLALHPNAVRLISGLLNRPAC